VYSSQLLNPKSTGYKLLGVIDGVGDEKYTKLLHTEGGGSKNFQSDGLF
jgi:hypothetical protein